MSPSQPDPSDTPGFMERLGTGMLQGVAQHSPMGNAVYNAFKPPTPPTAGPYARYQSGSTPPGAMTPMPAPVTPAPDTSGGMSGGSQWGASAPKSGLAGSLMKSQQQPAMGGAAGAAPDAGGAADAGADMGGDLADAALLAGGGIITKPTLARIGERGPEAVVPLTPRAGNKMQPDLLEGHIKNPSVPGVNYSRYKSYNRLGPGVGGAV